MSHVVTNRLVNLVGVGHDAQVKIWRDDFIDCLKEEYTEVCSLTLVVDRYHYNLCHYNRATKL